MAANLVVVALSASCASGRAFEQERISQIKVGETHQAQVGALLGEPQERHRTEVLGAQHEWWVYRRESAIISPFRQFMNGVTEEWVTVFFAPEGIVTSVVDAKTTYNLSPFSGARVDYRMTTRSTVGRSRRAVKFEDQTEQ